MAFKAPLSRPRRRGCRVAEPEIRLLATSLDGEELRVYFAEMSRIVAEAWLRAETGEVLPVLSSLAALPSLHGRIVEQCGALLEGLEEGAIEEPEVLPGLYL